MKALTHQQLRKLWTTFWKKYGHKIEKSSSLVPADKSLLWNNSGVAGLKDYFFGTTKPKNPLIANIQKCVRTNDLNLIGKTNRHLTFFEMLGNFAIGNYGRQYVIPKVWQFLTDSQFLGLPPERLVAVYFHEDKATKIILEKDLKLLPTQIIPGPRTSNFWDLGVGPCGPCLEFFYDYGPNQDPKNKGTDLLRHDEENERYVELWNVVFSEFLSDGYGQYVRGPQTNIDTGAGLERILCVLQDKRTPFATDLFAEARKTWATILQQNQIDFLSPAKNSIIKQSCYVVLDHVRSASFMLADLFNLQLTPNFQNKRDYVIRKLIRIASTKLFLLGVKKPQLALLARAFVFTMGKEYKNLTDYQEEICSFIEKEERIFLQLMEKAQTNKLFSFSLNLKKISGQKIFELVTTFGIPIEFIELIANQKKIPLDLSQFHLLWKQHQKISQSTTATWTKKNFFLTTENYQTPTQFQEKEHLTTVIVKAIFVNGKSFQKVSAGEEAAVIFDQTVLYAVQGGQAADKGWINFAKRKVEITDVQINSSQQFLHFFITVLPLRVGTKCQIELDQKWRKQTRTNHSATHLLQSALIQEFDNSARQVGSFHNGDYLRLDIQTKKKIDETQIKKVEKKINFLIQKSISPKIEQMLLQEAKKISALAFFTDRYKTKKVRVVSFGHYSQELCGGTHVLNTAEIEKFMFIKIMKKGSNNYRFYALTGTYKCQEEVTKTITQIKKYQTSQKENFGQTSQVLDKKFADFARGKITYLSLDNFWKTLQTNKNKSQIKKNLDKEINKFLRTFPISQPIIFDFKYSFLGQFIDLQKKYNLKFQTFFKKMPTIKFVNFFATKADLIVLAVNLSKTNISFSILDSRKKVGPKFWEACLKKDFVSKLKIWRTQNVVSGLIKNTKIAYFQEWIEEILKLK